MMRQDPPFNMAYISATHILEKLPNSTLVVNNPFEVRNSQKIFVTNFSHLMPKTLISRNINAIKELETIQRYYHKTTLRKLDKVYFTFFRR